MNENCLLLKTLVWTNLLIGAGAANPSSAASRSQMLFFSNFFFSLNSSCCCCFEVLPLKLLTHASLLLDKTFSIQTKTGAHIFHLQILHHFWVDSILEDDNLPDCILLKSKKSTYLAYPLLGVKFRLTASICMWSGWLAEFIKGEFLQPVVWYFLGLELQSCQPLGATWDISIHFTTTIRVSWIHCPLDLPLTAVNW